MKTAPSEESISARRGLIEYAAANLLAAAPGDDDAIVDVICHHGKDLLRLTELIQAQVDRIPQDISKAAIERLAGEAIATGWLAFQAEQG